MGREGLGGVGGGGKCWDRQKIKSKINGVVGKKYWWLEE